MGILTKMNGEPLKDLPAAKHIEKKKKKEEQRQSPEQKKLNQANNKTSNSNSKDLKNIKKKNRNNSNNNDKKKVQINKSHFSRINYLYQISRLNIISSEVTLDKNGSISGNTSQISRMYIKNMDSISKKTTSKIHPRLKRDICKNCQAVLIEGINKSVRLENYLDSRVGNLVIRCLNCEKVVKRFPLKIGKADEFVPLSERNEALISID